MSDKTIRKLYETRLKSYADDNGYPASFENAKFTKTDQLHLEIFLLPARTQSLSLDGVHRAYTGIVQINIVCTQNAGSDAAQTIVSDLNTQFANALRLIDDDGFPVVITSPVSAVAGFSRGSMFVVPTRFSYRSDTF